MRLKPEVARFRTQLIAVSMAIKIWRYGMTTTGGRDELKSSDTVRVMQSKPNQLLIMWAASTNLHNFVDFFFFSFIQTPHTNTAVFEIKGAPCPRCAYFGPTVYNLKSQVHHLLNFEYKSTLVGTCVGPGA